MNISLTPELEEFVLKEIESGIYRSASAVVRAGLCRLKEEKEGLGFTVLSQQELEGKLTADRRTDSN